MATYINCDRCGCVGTEMMVNLSRKCESVKHIWDRRIMQIN